TSLPSSGHVDSILERSRDGVRLDFRGVNRYFAVLHRCMNNSSVVRLHLSYLLCMNFKFFLVHFHLSPLIYTQILIVGQLAQHLRHHPEPRRSVCIVYLGEDSCVPGC
ncbi:hypothetical protein PFISCL1PPCAC_13987, partial [Pristionchus fissidentatus]